MNGKPTAKMAAPSRQRSEERKREAPQVKLVLSLETRNYLKAVGKRMNLPDRHVVDQMVRETKQLQREVEALGYRTIGEALAVLRVLREAKGC